MQELLKAIAHFQLPDIVTITQTMTDTQRKNALHQLSEMDPYNISRPRGFAQDLELWEYYNKVSNYFYYAILLCLRETTDFKQLKLRTIIYIKSRLGKEELEPYRLLIQPYLPPFWKGMDAYFDANREEGNFFKWCWDCYEKGWIDYQEEDFLRELVEVPWQSRWDITTDVAYLKAHPKVFDLLYLITTKELKVLDAASWKNQQGERGTGSPANYWTEVFTILIEEGYPISKDFVQQLYASLLNPWKKPHLDWHCRLLRLFNPSEEEVLAAQHTLFAVLGTGIASVIKFAMEQIATIAQHPAFDKDGFVSQLPLCFTVPKQPKTLLLGLDLLTQCFKAKHPTDLAYREQLAVLFTQPDVKVQEKVAELLTTYFNQEGLPEIIAPYRDYLKGKAQEFLQSLPSPNSSENSQIAYAARTSQIVCVTRTLTPISYPLTPENLLFLLGDCIREKSAATIDVFFESLIQLQNEIPKDYAKQLKPYIQQLRKKNLGTEAPIETILLAFLYCFTENKDLVFNPKYTYGWEECRELKKKLSEEAFKEYYIFYSLLSPAKQLPYLFQKAKTTLKRLQQKSTLPLLSTPTHEPFYIEAEILVDKLLQYEAQGENPDLDDLIVACNRLLFTEVSAAAKEKARQLKGTYAPAIQYYLGITDRIQLTEELLPLWAQITRIKHPDRAFPEFETTSAKEILGVIKPYYIDYGWETYIDYKGEKSTRFDYREKSPDNHLYYNCNGGEVIDSKHFAYRLTLTPHYPDALVCTYIARWVTFNEADSIRNMTLPLEAILRYDLRVRHSGWLYIGACLLFEKRRSRDLAYEYICQAIAREEDLAYLKTYLANVLAWDYLPIPRFIEFLDRPNPPAVKAFGKEVVKLYLEEAKKQDKLPRNHKKLAQLVD